MNTEKDTHVQVKRLANDTGYYANVFKRTEKIVSVTIYVVSHITQKDTNRDYLTLVRDTALKTHENALRTLASFVHDASQELLPFQYSLLTLDSTLRIAEAAYIIPKEASELLYEQIDAVQRYINNHYMKDKGFDIGSSLERGSTTKVSPARAPRLSRSRTRVQIPAGDISTDAYLVYSQLTDRGERIRTILEAKPQATIKDITEVITDVSEKTIQRELNSLIEKGQVLREGERRWSKYSIKK